MLDYIKKLSTYVSDLSATVLDFIRDTEVSDLVLGEDLHRILIQTEADHVKLGQDKYMDWECGTVWGAFWNAVEMAHKR